ncbi:MAG: ferrous iron transport protein A [Bacteroidia bacterium]|jgi:ferrous iron transport protein A
MLLSDIKKGDSAVITRIKPCEIRDKLMEMGCVPGTPIYLSLKAPLGDPIAYNIDGYYLSMRKSEAQQIEVKLVTNDGE